MIPIKLKTICEVVGGKPYKIIHHDKIFAVEIDSRKVKNNSLFCALKGDKYDGHHFAKNAIDNGALAVIADRILSDDIPQIIVPNTRKALGLISAYVRSQVSTSIVALTGSSGKTTVKEMTASILKNCGRTLYTQGNLNNDIGVPLTLLRLTPEDKFGVIELGANHLGEIAYTTQLVKPQTALINNVSEAHIEGFGSLAGVVKAKGEIFGGLQNDGVAIINLDSYAEEWLTKLNQNHKKIITFSLHNKQADFYPSLIEENPLSTKFIVNTPSRKLTIQLPLTGIHNISNALAAIALSLSVGADTESIVNGLAELKPVQGRLFPIKLHEQQLILDDTYNANIGSMSAAIDVLSQQKGYKVLVVGDMAELGAESKYYHQKIGMYAKNSPIDCVVSVGQESEMISKISEKGYHFPTKKEAVHFLLILLENQTKLTMLVKGSRSSKMEDIIDEIKKNKTK